MNREIYEFIFDLRASGFMHHTQKDLEMLFNNPAAAKLYDSYGNPKIEDGTRGVLSPNTLRDLKYFIVGCAFFSSSFLVENGGDAEYAYGVSDYYINKADEAHSLSDCQAIMLEMMQNFRELDEKRLGKKEHAIGNRYVREAIQYIRQHLYGKVSVSEIAAAVGIDQSYLNTLFCRETGSTLKRFILLQKTEEAKNMLAHTEKEIRQIGEALGFSSAPHFSRVFRKQYDITPSEYRRMKQAAGEGRSYSLSFGPATF